MVALPRRRSPRPQRDRDDVRLRARRRPDVLDVRRSPRTRRGRRPTRASGRAVHVTVYDRASTAHRRRDRSRVPHGLLDWMRVEFGPYPFGAELRVLTAPTYWSGFEHPGNIVLDDALAKQNGRRTCTTWRTSSITRWRTSGPATRPRSRAPTTSCGRSRWPSTSTFVYEDMADPAAAASTAAIWKSGSSLARSTSRCRGDKPALFDYYGDVYGPGPMVLFRQLEVLSSRDAVLAAIKSVLGTPHALSVDDLVAALEREPASTSRRTSRPGSTAPARRRGRACRPPSHPARPRAPTPRSPSRSRTRPRWPTAASSTSRSATAEAIASRSPSTRSGTGRRSRSPSRSPRSPCRRSISIPNTSAWCSPPAPRGAWGNRCDRGCLDVRSDP